MALLDEAVDSRPTVRVAAPIRDVLSACVCGVACALCAGLAWAGGLWLAEVLFDWRAEFASRPDQLPRATLAMTGIGALAGFVASTSVWITRLRLARTGVPVIAGCTLTGALGGALTPAMVVAVEMRVSAHLMSSLAWAAAAFVAGFVGYQLSRRRAAGEPAGVIVAWGVAPTLLVGAAWGIALAVEQYLTGENFARTLANNWEFAAPVALTARGALVGFVVGTVLSLILVSEDRGLGHRAATAVAWGVRLAIATAFGAAFSALALPATGNVIAPEASSALGFAAAGLIAGLSASRRSPSTPSPGDWDAVEEEHAEPPGAGVADAPARRLTPRTRFILRLLPLGVVSLGSLVAAVVVAPSPAALALAAVGLLGLAVIPVLWSQERRLAALERRSQFRDRD